MVEWSIEALRRADSIGGIVIAAPPGADYEFTGEDLFVVAGGDARSESVAHALERVETDLVAIHDAARPLLTAALVDEVVAALLADEEADGAIAATPVTDTVKRVTGPGTASSATHSPLTPYGEDKGARVIGETVDRADLWAAQTPQVFRVEALRGALEVVAEVIPAATDEAILVEAAGGRVLIHPAPAENVKVTTPLDLRLAELLLAERSAQQ
jgi:2-C-methyl-D-erythritol 4-phosphate cytidylyltransferase